MASTGEKAAIGGLACLFILVIWFVSLAIEAFVVMWAWNIFVVPYFGMPELTWLPALGLVLLLNIIGGAFKATVSPTNKNE